MPGEPTDNSIPPATPLGCVERRGVQQVPCDDNHALWQLQTSRSDEGSWFDHLTLTGNVHFLVRHFRREGTTIWRPVVHRAGARPSSAHWQVPDLLIAFDVDPELYHRGNGYIMSEQGNPPDFVLEVASESTSGRDLGPKRDDYAIFGIPEYWRFDETGGY